MQLFKKLIPPDNWKLPVILALGVFTGLGIFSFHISNASSYLGDKLETCVNCHIMAPQYATWSHSSHREWAHCNDCHVPQLMNYTGILMSSGAIAIVSNVIALRLMDV